MLDIDFKKNSKPITDDELLNVADAAEAHLASNDPKLRDVGLLLSKMALRILELNAKVTQLRKVSADPLAKAHPPTNPVQTTVQVSAADGQDESPLKQKMVFFRLPEATTDQTRDDQEAHQ